MRYINSYYNLFDNSPAYERIYPKYKYIVFTNQSSGKININSEKKIYISFEISINYIDDTKAICYVKNSSDTTIFSIYKNNAKLIICPTSTYSESDSKYIIDVSSSSDIWYKLYITYDPTLDSDNVAIFVNNVLKGKFSINENANVSNILFYTEYSSIIGPCISLRNIIISDEKFSKYDTITEVTPEIISTEWDNTDGVLSTSETEKSFEVGINSSDESITGTIDGASLVFTNTNGTEGISSLSVDIINDETVQDTKTVYIGDSENYGCMGAVIGDKPKFKVTSKE